MADDTEVPVVLKLFAQKTSSVNTVLQETKKGFNDLAGEVTAVAKSAAVISASFTAALGGIVAAAVNVAGQFESLQAKLTSTLGSSEAAARSFQEALQFAASTPFDVQGIVQATVQITAFGQSAQRILPLAANLAAAFSERVEDVGQILGKAFSGSLEGFESLRNRLGISNVLLQKFGAELTKTGGISISTAEGLTKAQNALEKIIQTRFGDATARQSQTLFGALSNLGDAVQRTAAAFGTSLIPVITAASRFLTGIIERFEKLSPSTRQFIAVAALAATGIGALTTGALALTAALTAGLGTVVSFAGAIGTIGGAASGAAATAAGLSSMAGAVSSLTGILSGAGASVLTFLGPLGVLTALAGGAAYLALNKYSNEVAQADKAVVAQARTQTEARNALRDYIDTVEQVTGKQGQLIQQAGRVSDFAAAVRGAFSQMTPAEFIANTEKANVSLEGTAKQLEKNQIKAKLFKEQVDTLTTAASLLRQQQAGVKTERIVGGGPIGAQLFSPEEQETLDRAREVMGKFNLTAEEVEESLKGAKESLNKFLVEGVGLKAFQQNLQAVSPLFGQVAERAANLQDYLKFASKSDDVGVLTAAMGKLNTSIAESEQNLGKMGIHYSNLAELAQRLLTGSTKEKADIQGLLGLREAQENITKKLANDDKKRIDDLIRTEEAGIQRNRILRGENKAEEIKIYQQLLKEVQKGSQEELHILSEIASRKQGLKREEVARQKETVDKTKQTLDNLVGTSNSGLEALRATGTATATETSKALKSVLGDLDGWAVKNKALIGQNPQLAEAFNKVRAGFQGRFDSSELDKPKEKLSEALVVAKEFGTAAVTNEQKFQAAIQARDSLQKLADSGTVFAAKEKLALRKEINAFETQSLTIQQAITKETNSQNRQTAGLKRDGLSQELEMLKQQQAIQGKSPFLAQQIADKEKVLLAQRVQAIREQEQQEMDQGATKAQAQERTELRLTQLKNEEVMKRMQAEQSATAGFTAELQKRQAEEERFRAQRQGGPNSPLIGLQGLSATSSFLPNFSLGSFNSDLRPNFGSGQPDQRQLLRVRQTVANDIQQGEKLASKGSPPGQSGQGYPGETGAAASSAAAAGTVVHQSVSINGSDVDKPAIKALAREAIRELMHDNQLRGGL